MNTKNIGSDGRSAFGILALVAVFVILLFAIFTWGYSTGKVAGRESHPFQQLTKEGLELRIYYDPTFVFVSPDKTDLRRNELVTVTSIRQEIIKVVAGREMSPTTAIPNYSGWVVVTRDDGTKFGVTGAVICCGLDQVEYFNGMHLLDVDRVLTNTVMFKPHFSN